MHDMETPNSDAWAEPPQLQTLLDYVLGYLEKLWIKPFHVYHDTNGKHEILLRGLSVIAMTRIDWWALS